MLAQNFRSAHSLGISAKQHSALVKTLVLMETEAITHVKQPHSPKPMMSYDSYDRAHLLQFTGHFSMDHWRVMGRDEDGSCQTICCIGGTAELIGHVSFLENSTIELENLFYPPTKTKAQWKTIKVAQAAHALRNYLTRGRPYWDEVMPGKTK